MADIVSEFVLSRVVSRFLGICMWKDDKMFCHYEACGFHPSKRHLEGSFLMDETAKYRVGAFGSLAFRDV